MTAIINTKLVMEDGIIWDGALTYENGRIVEVGTADTVTIPAGAEIIDAKGLYTAPASSTSTTTALPTICSATSL